MKSKHLRGPNDAHLKFHLAPSSNLIYINTFDIQSARTENILPQGNASVLTHRPRLLAHYKIIIKSKIRSFSSFNHWILRSVIRQATHAAYGHRSRALPLITHRVCDLPVLPFLCVCNAELLTVARQQSICDSPFPNALRVLITCATREAPL